MTDQSATHDFIIRQISGLQRQLESTNNRATMNEKEIARMEARTAEQVAQLRTDIGRLADLPAEMAKLRATLSGVESELRTQHEMMDDFREQQQRAIAVTEAAEKERTKRTIAWATAVGGAVSAVVTIVSVIFGAAAPPEPVLTPEAAVEAFEAMEGTEERAEAPDAGLPAD